MKILAIILFILNTSQSHAKCSSEGFYVFPNKKLDTNSCVLIEGYGNTLKLVELLTKEHPVYLESDNNHKVKLNIVYFNEGSFRINQVILKPEQTLDADKSYTLKIDNLDKAESIPYALQPEHNPIKWHTSTSINIQLAKLLSDPKLIKKSTIHYGCGPSITAEFEFITDSHSTVLVKTELMNLTDGTTSTYFLKTSKKETLTIGHGMCSGAFSFKPDNIYQARFSIMDNCNSYQNDWSDWIEFDSPNRSL